MRYIGIDLGGTNIAVGIVEEDGRLLAKTSVPTEAGRPSDEVIADMAQTAHRLLRETGVSMEEIDSVGVGSPGSVDRVSGMVLSACNLNFQRVDLAGGMRKYFSKPIYVENDANCAAWAEAMAGAAAGVRHSVMVTLGTGIGGGIVIDGRLYGGFNNFGGEFGHTVIRAGGALCPCGRRGCFEAYASATALVRDTRRAAEADRRSLLWSCAEQEGKFSGRTAFWAARLGDPTAREVVERYLEALTEGVVNIITIFQPQVLVIGGGISHEGAALFEPLTERVMRIAYDAQTPPERRTEIKAALLGNDAGIVGAALLGKTEQ